MANKQVKAAFLNGTSARSSNGNLWTDGETLFSYNTPIARRYKGLVLVCAERFSVTTSNHQSVSGALRVPFIGVHGGRTQGTPTDWEEKNTEYLVGEIEAIRVKTNKARTEKSKALYARFLETAQNDLTKWSNRK